MEKRKRKPTLVSVDFFWLEISSYALLEQRTFAPHPGSPNVPTASSSTNTISVFSFPDFASGTCKIKIQ